MKLDCSSTHDFVDGSIISTDESVVNDDDETSDDDTLAGMLFLNSLDLYSGNLKFYLDSEINGLKSRSFFLEYY